VLLVRGWLPGFELRIGLVAQDKLATPGPAWPCVAQRESHDTSQDDEAKILAQLRTVVDRLRSARLVAAQAPIW